MPDFRTEISILPRCIPDCDARSYIIDGAPFEKHYTGFPDMFGVKWRYVDVAMGAMVEPGVPMLEDMNDWKEVVKLPDPDSWDWEGQAELSKEHLSNPYLPVTVTILTGFFERIISLMDFEGAAMALIDEDQKDSVHEFLDCTADIYIRILEHCMESFHITGAQIHDDWGSQRAPFFSLELVREMLVPHMKKVADFMHSKGLIYNMHSCGNVEKLIPAMIDIGVDIWSGQEQLNDMPKMYELYGDRIMIGVNCPPISEDMPEEEIDAVAKAFVDQYVRPGKIGIMAKDIPVKNDYFFTCVYRYSREKLGGA